MGNHTGHEDQLPNANYLAGLEFRKQTNFINQTNQRYEKIYHM